MKLSHYLLILMPMGGWVKLFTPQNTAEVLQQKGIAVISQTIKVNGDKNLNIEKKTG